MAEAKNNFSTLCQPPLVAERVWETLQDAIYAVAYRGQPPLWQPPREGAAMARKVLPLPDTPENHQLREAGVVGLLPPETNKAKRRTLEHLKRCTTAAGKLLLAFQAGTLETLCRLGADPHAEWKPPPPGFWRDIRSLAEATLVRSSPNTLSPRIAEDPRLVRYIFLVDQAQRHALFPPKPVKPWKGDPPKTREEVDRLVIAYGKSAGSRIAAYKAIRQDWPELKIPRVRVDQLVPKGHAGAPPKSRHKSPSSRK